MPFTSSPRRSVLPRHSGIFRSPRNHFNHLGTSPAAGTASATTSSSLNVDIPGTVAATDPVYMWAVVKPYTVNFIVPEGWTKLIETTNGTIGSGINTGSVRVALFVYNEGTTPPTDPTVLSVDSTPTVLMAKTYSNRPDIMPSGLFGGVRYRYQGNVFAYDSGVDSTDGANFTATGTHNLGVVAAQSGYGTFYGMNSEGPGYTSNGVVPAGVVASSGIAGGTFDTTSTGHRAALSYRFNFALLADETGPFTASYTCTDNTSGAAIFWRQDVVPAEDVKVTESEHVSIVEDDDSFPKFVAEVAFNNNFDETKYASSGFTDVTQFMDGFSTSRSRTYEIDEIEAGTCDVVFDNYDGRFTAGVMTSPYAPYVTSNRRLRLRGKNMVNPNLAMGGGKYRNMVGFRQCSNAYSQAPELGTHDPFLLPGDIGGYHASCSLSMSAISNQSVDVAEWYLPVELGQRLTHSAYVWRKVGYEPADSSMSLVIDYYDANGLLLDPIDKDGAKSNTVTWSQTPEEPMRVHVSDQPPPHALYGIMRLRMTLRSGQLSSVYPLKWAVTGLQTEVPENNLAPLNTRYAYFIMGEGVGVDYLETSVPYTGFVTVNFTWEEGDVGAYMIMSRLVPGQTYTVIADAMRLGGPDVIMSVDDGGSGALLDVDSSYRQLHMQFVASAPEQKLSFIASPTATSNVATFGDGDVLKVVRVSVLPGAVPSQDEAPEQDVEPYVASQLGALGTADQNGLTDWEEPKPIFDGWIEDWPAEVRHHNSSVSVTAVDRLGWLGEIDLQSTLREELFKDKADILMPLDDSPIDSQGEVSQVGEWSRYQGPTVPLQPMQGDIGAATYTLGVEGPTDETGLNANHAIVSGDGKGYVLELPYSDDYDAPLPNTPITFETYLGPIPRTWDNMFFYATWGKTYKEDGTPASVEPELLYQGTYCTADPAGCADGDYRSLLGFNYPLIQQALAGKIIKAVYLSIQNTGWYLGQGRYAAGSHNYTESSAPATFDLDRVNAVRWRYPYPDRVNFRYAMRLDVTFGNELASGAATGITIGPAFSNDPIFMGSFYGIGPAYAPPQLIITYRNPDGEDNF